MPVMPRRKGKASAIAQRILGVTKRKKKKETRVDKRLTFEETIREK